MECELCHTADPSVAETDGLVECGSCRNYRLYYHSLSPDEMRAEHESMARHVQEEIERGDS